MPAPPGGLALLIGKRLSKKGSGHDEPPGPPMVGDEDGAGQQDEMENSAIADFMSAKDPETAKAALKDFLESCYPQLAGGEEEEEEEEATEPEPES